MLFWNKSYFQLKTLKTKLYFKIILNPFQLPKSGDKVFIWKSPSLYVKEHPFLQRLKVRIKNFCTEHLKIAQLLTLSVPCSCLSIASYFLFNSVTFVLILTLNFCTGLSFSHEVLLLINFQAFPTLIYFTSV